MSPMFMAQKGKPPVRPSAPTKDDGAKFGAREWGWIALAMLSLWLLLTGLHRLFESRPAPAAASFTPAGPTAPVPPPEPEPPRAPSLPPPPPSVYMVHSEAVAKTVESLRQHARECPDAPDVLSEERIKAIAAQGGLVQ